MSSGAGYWLDPRSGDLHSVTTHNDWLLDPDNQKTICLTRKYIRVLQSLDRMEIDEIRMIGVMFGLIRFRDYQDSIHIQFFASPPKVESFLAAIVEAVPRVTRDKFPALKIQNLCDDATVHIQLADLDSKLQAAESVLIAREHISQNDALRSTMESLVRQAMG